VAFVRFVARAVRLLGIPNDCSFCETRALFAIMALFFAIMVHCTLYNIKMVESLNH
jgi:hypothetical protein